MVDESENLWIDKNASNFILLRLLQKLKYVLHPKHSYIKIAFLKHLYVIFQVLGYVFFAYIELVWDKLDNLFYLRIFLKLV